MSKGNQPYDPDTLIRWFASAILCGFDTANRRAASGWVSEEALRLAHEFLADPDDRAQVKVKLAVAGMPLMADMIDEALVMARELIRLSATEDLAQKAMLVISQHMNEQHKRKP